MTEITASRTLVKSPPELWAECSDASSLARHLGEFGEIRITRLEPETAVAWEGEEFSGTVRLEPSGWGTRVVISAQSDSQPQPASEIALPPVAVEPAPAEPPPAEPPPARTGWLPRLLARFGRKEAPPPQAAAPPAPAPEPDPAPDPAQPEAAAPPAAEERLHSALDSLGQAHRRPFSRG